MSISYNNSVHSIMTTINKNVKSNSARDYREHMERVRQSAQLMWDDKCSASEGTPTKTVGGLFVFVKNLISIEFHIVMEIHSPQNRLKSWSQNVGQTDRNVLYLSNMIYTMNWLEFGKLSVGCNFIKNFFREMYPSIEVVTETGEIIVYTPSYHSTHRSTPLNPSLASPQHSLPRVHTGNV